MPVYVDQALFPFRGMMMCHLWADNVDELHAMADRLGLRRAWFQCPPKASWEHYDVSKGVRAKALALGALETDRYGASYHDAKRRGRTAMVERIEALRTRDGRPADGIIRAADDLFTEPLRSAAP